MSKTEAVKAISLKTNNLIDPLGINGSAPEFSWKQSPESSAHEQSAWEIRAGRNPDLSGEILWDSGKIIGNACSGHRWGGPALQSRDRIYWQVKLWDENGAESEWSTPAVFEIGLQTLEDWDTQWIGFPGGWSGHGIYFQKYFSVPENFHQARVYLGGPSWSEAWINGHRLGGNAVLQPAQTDFSKSWHYLTYDVTEFLKSGENVFAVHAGAGWYGTPVICYRIEADGKLLTRSHFLSLPNVWKSPVSRNSVYGGEEYDAGKEVDPSWKLPGSVTHDPETYAAFPTGDGAFPCVRSAFRVSGISGVPRGLEEEPVVPQEEITPVSIQPIAENRWSVDFGRNFAGWCRLKVCVPKGTVIKMLFSEIRNPDLSANQENLLGEETMDTYIAKGDPKGEVFEPHFTYHGFRYVEIQGLKEEPSKETLTGIVLRTDCRRTGKFSCGNDLVNRIFTMILHTEESNLYAVPTDCPQRTERMGWLNDLMARGEGSQYLFDESNLLEKWLRDIAETQDPKTGDIPMTAPFYWGFEPDPVCSSFVETAWLNYAFHGKYALLEDLYPNFKRWVELLIKLRDDDGILRTGGFVGDWVPPVKFNAPHIAKYGIDTARNFTVPHELVATAVMHYALDLLIRIARILKKETDSLTAISERIREDFLRCFRSAPGRLKEESQSAYAFALYCGMFPEEECSSAAARLAELFRNNGCKHTTGNIGTKYLLAVLSEYGYADLVWKLISSEDYPGWGYMLANGATTLWERWELAEGGGMNSHNHPMLNSPLLWFFRYAGGIRILPDTAGFDHFELAPFFPEGLDHAEAEFQSCRGKVLSAWKRNDSKIEYRFEIPSGCRAMVKLPGRADQEFKGGKYSLEITPGTVSRN